MYTTLFGATIALDNGLAPDRCQIIFQTKASLYGI